MPKVRKVEPETVEPKKKGRPAGSTNKVKVFDNESTVSPHRDVTWQCSKGCKITQPANFFEIVCDEHQLYCTPINNKVVRVKRTKQG